MRPSILGFFTVGMTTLSMLSIIFTSPIASCLRILTSQLTLSVEKYVMAMNSDRVMS